MATWTRASQPARITYKVSTFTPHCFITGLVLLCSRFSLVRLHNIRNREWAIETIPHRMCLWPPASGGSSFSINCRPANEEDDDGDGAGMGMITITWNRWKCLADGWVGINYRFMITVRWLSIWDILIWPRRRVMMLFSIGHVEGRSTHNSAGERKQRCRWCCADRIQPQINCHPESPIN